MLCAPGLQEGSAWAAVHGLPLMLPRAREGSRPEGEEEEAWAGVAVDGRGCIKGLWAAQGWEGAAGREKKVGWLPLPWLLDDGVMVVAAVDEGKGDYN